MVPSIQISPLTLWPIFNFIGFRQVKIAREAGKELLPNQPTKTIPYPTGILDYLNRMLGMVPIIFMVYCTNKLYPIEEQMREAKENPLDFSFNGWIFKIMCRDMIFGMTLIWAWFLILDHSFITDIIKPLKFNQKTNNYSELFREIPYSISTILMGTAFEVAALHYYANGAIPRSNYYLDIFESNQTMLVTFLWVFLCPFWRDGHFYWVHRLIHPWNTEWVPDLGYYLFEYAHYLHHQSMNFQCWSGLSMHPIEGFLLETACIVPCFFLHHPILIWLVKVDLTYKAIHGHDGYDYPGQGGWDHYLHHVKFNCNYGTSNAPFDWLFGSWDNGAAEWKKLMRTQRNKKK